MNTLPSERRIPRPVPSWVPSSAQRTPDGVRQQIWAHLLVHHALRELMLRTAATRGLDPDWVPFTETLRSARRSVTVTPGSFSS
ncbi:hypothetical protein [Streptomyces sp. NPDC001340]